MNSGMTPRLGPWIVRRQGLEEWLGRFKSVPVRFLIAPPGFGKTVAVLGYLRNVATNGHYCALRARASREAIYEAVRRALPDAGARLESHESLLRALASRAPIELAIDFDDLPNDDGAAAIVELIDDLPDDVSLLVACRSRASLSVGRFVSDGVGVLCDAERLAFGLADIRNVAETCGVQFTHPDVLRMLEVTDGWPQVVSGALRKAAEDNCSLAQAFENWRTRHGHLFNEFVAETLKYVSEGDADLVLKVMIGSSVGDRSNLQTLEEQGLFVIHTSGGYRPLRALSRSRLYDRYGRQAEAAEPLQVRLFGWFLAEINGQPIEWIRRRDRQIFKYLALKPNGRASRTEIGQIFWPEAERHLVAQSVRTVCSNIRKAIARIVGFNQVESYFRSEDELALDLENVIVDVHQFVQHVNDGDAQYERGELRAAHGHYCSAAHVYRGDLLIADSHEPWVAALDRIFNQRNAVVVDRVNEIVATLDYQEGELPRASGE